MELDNMKQLWQKMDDVINKQQAMNESIIKRMLHERNTTSLKNITNMEYMGIVITAILAVLLLTQMPRIGRETGVIVSYIISLLVCVAAIVFSWYKIQYLAGMSKEQLPVTAQAEKTERFRLLIAKERMVSLIIGPVIISVFYVVMFYLVTGINVLDNITKYMVPIIAAIIVYSVILPVLYRLLYFRQIETINSNLKEIEEFKG